MINDIKPVLRITNNSFDVEINDLIEAAKTDLQLSGVKNFDEEDPLIKRAVTTYVKANFGWDNPDSDKLNVSYNMIKQHLTLSTDYNEVV